MSFPIQPKLYWSEIGENIASLTSFWTDGTVLFPLDCVRENKVLRTKLATRHDRNFMTRNIPMGAVNKVWLKTISDARDASKGDGLDCAEYQGDIQPAVEDIPQSTGLRTVVLGGRCPDPAWFNSRKLQSVAYIVRADAICVVGKGKYPPAVLLRGGIPVALIMPVKVRAQSDADRKGVAV